MSRTVLVVEDDAAIQEVLELALGDEGYRVVASRDGFEALSLIEHATPDLILLDWRMPRMDGQAFAQQLSERGLRPGIPILVLTADGRAEASTAAVGVEGYLRKPFDLPELLDQVARLAGGRVSRMRPSRATSAASRKLGAGSRTGSGVSVEEPTASA